MTDDQNKQPVRSSKRNVKGNIKMTHWQRTLVNCKNVALKFGNSSQSKLSYWCISCTQDSCNCICLKECLVIEIHDTCQYVKQKHFTLFLFLVYTEWVAAK